MAGRSRSSTHSEPSTSTCVMASVKGIISPRWTRKRSERTGSMRAQPRLAGRSGMAGDGSGQLRGRGRSQRKPRRIRRTSSAIDATASSTCETPYLPEYQDATALTHVGEHERRRAQVRDRGPLADRLLGDLEGVLERARGPEPEPVHDLALAADHDHLAHVLEGEGSPVPGIERVHAVVGVALAVEL